jgi:hypothetical protein
MPASGVLHPLIPSRPVAVITENLGGDRVAAGRQLAEIGETGGGLVIDIVGQQRVGDDGAALERVEFRLLSRISHGFRHSKTMCRSQSAARINLVAKATHGKTVLCDIKSDCGNCVYGRWLSRWVASTDPSWHINAARGHRPPHRRVLSNEFRRFLSSL